MLLFQGMSRLGRCMLRYLPPPILTLAGFASTANWPPDCWQLELPGLHIQT